ncbi:MAG: peptide chain release factor N(5)-glutamine methyltransferase [Wigglesworthia glossinidia]|nr:peptide chain release factor N(5)-glutamine methyltransferase [Wigglesworthia glossinidia]
MVTWNSWIQKATKILRASKKIAPEIEAEILLQYVLGIDRAKMIAYEKNHLTCTQYNFLNILLSRRKLGEPIAYLINNREFWSINLYIRSGIFIPRSDTECLVKLALSVPLSKKANVLDLGSGSGAISLALGLERPTWKITGIDKSSKAIKISKKNSDKLKVKNVFFKKESWKKLQKTVYYSMIVSNPPYIASQDPHLLIGDLKFEPKSALISGKDGLQDIKIICKISKNHLKNHGWLLIEHGFQQAYEVRKILLTEGYSLIRTHMDYGGNDRVTQAAWIYI